MKYLSGFLVLFMVFSNTYAQESNTYKWEYGLHLHIDNSIIKPVATDTFTNKTGAGFGLLLERKFGNARVQASPNLTWTRYADDFENRNSSCFSGDLAVKASFPMDKARQTFFEIGPMFGYTLDYFEASALDGKRFSENRNQLITGLPFDYGAQIGVGLDLNPGTRLTLSYIDYFNGGQKASRINGRIDYVQFGIQLRINELSNSAATKEKITKARAAIDSASVHAHRLSKTGDGTMVFIIATDKKSYFELNEQNNNSEEILKGVIESIYNNYTHGYFVVTLDTMIDGPNDQSFQVFEKDGSLRTYDKVNSVHYYGKIDELFLSQSGNAKWGLFIFDYNMNLLEEPFPFYTAYPELDTRFRSTSYMIRSFSEKVKLLDPGPGSTSP
jgi:hypothetical protein